MRTSTSGRRPVPWKWRQMRKSSRGFLLLKSKTGILTEILIAGPKNECACGHSHAHTPSPRQSAYTNHWFFASQQSLTLWKRKCLLNLERSAQPCGKSPMELTGTEVPGVNKHALSAPRPPTPTWLIPKNNTSGSPILCEHPEPRSLLSASGATCHLLFISTLWVRCHYLCFAVEKTEALEV